MGGDPHFGSIHPRQDVLPALATDVISAPLERAHGTGSGDGSGNLTERLQDSWTTVVSGQSAICYVQIRRCGFVFALQVPSGFGGLQYLNFYPVGTFFP